MEEETGCRWIVFPKYTTNEEIHDFILDPETTLGAERTVRVHVIVKRFLINCVSFVCCDQDQSFDSTDVMYMFNQKKIGIMGNQMEVDVAAASKGYEASHLALASTIKIMRQISSPNRICASFFFQFCTRC